MLNRTVVDPPFHMLGARGSRVWGQDGVELIDLTSGWNVVNAGWNNDAINSMWQTMAADLPFRPSWTSDDNLVALQELFRGVLPGFALVPSCTGAEAIDNALKATRMATGRPGVLSLSGSYHGSSTGSSLAAGSDVPHLVDLGLDAFRASVPIPCDEGDLHALRALLLERTDIGAFVIETVATNTGCDVPSDEVLGSISTLASELGILIVCDEIGTGINRTGHLLSFLGGPLKPNIVTLGKALTNGFYPLSLCLIADELTSLIDPDAFGSTYAATPAGCCAALATLSFHQEHALGKRASESGALVRKVLEDGLSDCEFTDGVHGRGLELAIHLRWNRPGRKTARSLLHRLRERGVFATTSPGDCHLMIMPPLVICKKELDTAAMIIIDELCENFA